MQDTYTFEGHLIGTYFDGEGVKTAAMTHVDELEVKGHLEKARVN